MPGHAIQNQATVPAVAQEPSSAPTMTASWGAVREPYATNRVAILMAHTTRYAFEPQARLARDIGVARSTISRILSGGRTPTLPLALKIVAALEDALGLPLDPRDVFSPDGTYPTRSGCQVAGCKGCMPEAAYDRHGSLKPLFRSQRPGDWTLAPSHASAVTAPESPVTDPA